MRIKFTSSYRSIAFTLMLFLLATSSFSIHAQPNNRPAQLPTYQQKKLTATDKSNEDYLGTSVSLSADGNTALVGAYGDDEGAVYGVGAAYIFTRIGETWVQSARLSAADKASGDYFGYSVALSKDGNTAVIGAYNKNIGGENYVGRAYIFVRDGSTWTQQAQLSASDAAAGDFFGIGVAISGNGDTVTIGADHVDDTGFTDNGAVYVFTRNGTVWTQQAKLMTTIKKNAMYFGWAIKLSDNGNTALIGAYIESSGGIQTYEGAAYVFTRSGTTWTQQARLIPSDIASQDFFGWSVALSSSGDTAMIGSLFDSTGSIVSHGAVYVFTRAGGVWTQQTKLLASDKETGDQFGSGIALSDDGSKALIGAEGEGGTLSMQRGAAYIFTYSAGVWNQQTILNANDAAAYDNMGNSVALSSDGEVALIGAYKDDDRGTTDNGSVYIFGNTPLPTATPTTTPNPPRPDTIGVYDNGTWYLRNSNSTGFPDIAAIFGGDPADLPVVGDWNGDGTDTIGIYRTSTGFFFLSDSNLSPAVNYVFIFGNPGDQPFAGRWTVDMTGDGVGVYRDTNGILYQRKLLTGGFDDFFAVFGNPGDKPVAGDWNGDGLDSIGVYRSATSYWYMTYNSQPAGITFDDIRFSYTIAAHKPITGDWDADGVATVGFYTAAGVFSLHPMLDGPGTNNNFAFGPAGSKPVAGKWGSPTTPPPGSVIIIGPPASSQIDGGNAD